MNKICSDIMTLLFGPPKGNIRVLTDVQIVVTLLSFLTAGVLIGMAI